LPPEIRGATVSPEPSEKPKKEVEPKLDALPGDAPAPSPPSVP